MSQETSPDQDLYGGSYVLAERLGAGGTGTVYRALHALLRQERAVKVLHSGSRSSHRGTLTQLQLEASVFGRLRGNPVLVMPYEVGFDAESQTHFLAMELLNGSDLARWVSAEGPLAVGKAMDVLRQVAAGLDAAHAYVDETGRTTPILHRDLTPSNLFLIDPQSSTPRAKILDFGLAAVLDRTSQPHQRKAGTALFRAYEQANGLELVPQTDIWSLGLVVHFLLTGEIYWRKRDASELQNEITHEPLAPPSTRLREQLPELKLPDGFDAWFLRCLERVPSRRFPAAGEAIDELQLCFDRAGLDPQEPLGKPRRPKAYFLRGPRHDHSQSHARTLIETQAGQGASTSLSENDHGEFDTPVLVLAEHLQPLILDVLRVSDDLMTATGHYLSFPPLSREMLARQLEGVAHHVTKYNDARDLLRHRLNSHEGLLRALHAAAPVSLYYAASEALSAGLTFTERYPVPNVRPPGELLSEFGRECTYWQAERVLLQAQLELGRIRVRSLDAEVAATCSQANRIGERPNELARRERALQAARLLEQYADATAELSARVRAWIDDPKKQTMERRAWDMAPAIEALNDAYVEIERSALAVRMTLLHSEESFHQRVTDALLQLHDFQWYEFRPLLNGPLVKLVRFLCRTGARGDTRISPAFDERGLDEETTDPDLVEDFPRWHRLARALSRASERYRISRR